MTEQEYQSLSQKWDPLDDKRLELWSRHDPQGDVYFEDEAWYRDYESIQEQQDKILAQMDAYEDAQMSKPREFDCFPSLVDGRLRQPNDFAWDHWVFLHKGT